MSDLIRREDAIKAVAVAVLDDRDELEAIKALPSAEAIHGANLINRHDAITVIRDECWKCNNTINDDLFMRIMSLPTSRQTDCTEFIMWLIEVVLDDEDWELNAVAYGEIIARKLKKLGLLEVKDGYYIRHIENNTKESDLVYRPSAEGGDADMTVIPEGTGLMKPCPDNGADLISRANAIKALTEFYGYSIRMVDEITDLVNSIPSAEAVSFEDAMQIRNTILFKEYMRGRRDAEAVQGEWIEKDGELVCSVCGNSVSFTRTPKGWVLGRFCQTCGSKMSEGGDEDD